MQGKWDNRGGILPQSRERGDKACRITPNEVTIEQPEGRPVEALADLDYGVEVSGREDCGRGPLE